MVERPDGPPVPTANPEAPAPAAADGRSELLEQLGPATTAELAAAPPPRAAVSTIGSAGLAEGRSALLEALGAPALTGVVPRARADLGAPPSSPAHLADGRSALLDQLAADPGDATAGVAGPPSPPPGPPSTGRAAPSDGRSALVDALARPPESGARSIGQLAPGTAVGTRYQVVRLLGRGGMGEVYLARDRELGREVALKLVAPQLAGDARVMDRFRREIQLSSLVTHPNVLRVYDLGESGGLRFLTMQYIEGRSLAALEAAERPLPIERAVSLFRQVCEGLAAAHDQGVLHRDLKPQNVMVDAAGRAFVTDFGLATSGDLSTMTQAGTVVGTPHYMSPEQVRGEPLDARSDLFSAGVILYELLTGALPFQGDTVFAVMMRRTLGPPTPARQLNPAVPPHLAAILDRCLTVDPALRYGSARELLRDLDAEAVKTSLAHRLRRHRRAWAGAAVAVALAAIAWPAYRAVARRLQPVVGEAAVAVPLVGVAPFANRTGDAALDWTGDGIARLVADDLALSRHVRIAAPDRMGELRRGAADDAAFRRAAADAGVTHLLTGDVLAGPKGFTVSSRLVEVAGGKEVAARRVEAASRQDVVGAATEVSQAARRGLHVPLAEGVNTYAADFATQNGDAYEAYLAGLAGMATYHYRDAERQLRAAVEKAPDFAMAHLRLANVLAATGRSEEALTEARVASAQASRLPEREAGYVRANEAYVSRRTDEAVRQYQALAARFPYDAEPRQFLAQIYFDLGDWKAAAELGQALVRLDSKSPNAHAILGSALLGAKDFSQALAEFRTYAAVEPNSANAHHLMADSYRAQGVLDLAAEEYTSALRIDPRFHFSTTALAEVEVLRGRLADAERLLAPLVEDAEELPRFRVDAALGLAGIRRAQGRFREAADGLVRADPVLQVEQGHRPMAIALRVLCALEVGDARGAEALLRTSMDPASGPPATYLLFALATVQLRQGRTAEARATAARILAKAPAPPDPDRTMQKAAAYLAGLAALREGKADQARRDLSDAVAGPGDEYAGYRLALAMAHRAASALPEALANAKQAQAPLDLLEPRLDLEVDRVRARLEEARVLAAMGRADDAAAAAGRFLEAWARADPGLEEVAEARRLAGR